MTSTASRSGASPGSDSFATTRWSVIASARDGSSVSARQALAWLCERYWYPLYAYLRRKGHSADDASDLAQSFFAYLLERDTVAVADQQRGRFRDFLLGSLKHFVSHDAQAKRAKKRGGGRLLIRMDALEAEQRYSLEPVDIQTPEKLFARRWALEMLDRVLQRLKDTFRTDGKSAQFEALKECLTGNASAESYAAIGQRLKMNEGAVKVAVFRLRRKYRELLKDEIARTVAQPEHPAEVEAELNDLLAALAR